MPQPTEAVERLAPSLRRRIEFEGGAAACCQGPAGENEKPGVDVARNGRVTGAQILRREEKPLRRVRSHHPARPDQPGKADPKRPDRFPQGKPVQPPSIRPPLHAHSPTPPFGAASISEA